ncbi:MAG: hypothetical protein K2N38_02325 [Oscillospiraceae bacterium]|nr:hypothetical protein [Oscillospiraceae bacterium]
MNLEEDMNEVVELASKYIETKFGGNLKSFDRSDIKNTITKFLKNMSSIEQFKFFPFEIMTTEMVARFCAEHLIMRGAVSKSTDTIDKKDGKQDNVAQKKEVNRNLMSDIKNERFNKLRSDRIIDSFIINKEQLGKIIEEDKYCGNVPDQIEEILYNELDKFKKSILNPVLQSDSDIIDVKGLKADLCQKFNDFFALLKGNLYSIKGTPKHMDYIFWQLQIQSCMIEAVNHIIYRTMILFIMDRGGSSIVFAPMNRSRVSSLKKIYLCPHKKFKSPKVIENIKQLHFLNRLSKFTDTFIESPIKSNIEHSRKEWISANKPGVGELMMQELSLKFAFYLHDVVENGYKYDIIKTLDKENKKDYMHYDEKWESSAKNREEWKNFLTECNSPQISDSQIEESMERAREFFYQKGFDAGEKDFIYCVKAFCYELYVCNSCIRDTNGKRITARNISKDKEIPLNESIILNLAYDRAHFRQKRQLNAYMKFYDILFKIYKITEASYLTLGSETGLDILWQVLIIYLQFFEDF